MKISNETKVGALTAVAITLLVLGFNFLKGRSLLKTGHYIYAQFPDAKGLMVSHAVMVNGFPIGSVYEIENVDANLKLIKVGIKLKSSYNIPINSIATIASSPLGSPSIEITLGKDSINFLKDGGIINTENPLGMLDKLSSKLDPIGDNLNKTLITLNNTLLNLNSIVDPNTKNNLQSSVANIQKLTDNLTKASVSLTEMLNQQNGALAKSMTNMSNFTSNLNNQNDKINGTLANIETTTKNLSNADIEGLLTKMKSTLETLNTAIAKLNSNSGSLGLLMNDKALYNNLTNTVRSANILMDDLRTHPKRYVNISVFGRKEKGGALQAPLDTTYNK
jgi:phospholipid/cholesterol/gamma-HCH transport system substrate-binding protein